MDGVSGESRALLDRYVAARTPAPDAVERAWVDVQERIAEGPPAMSMDEPASTVRMVPVRVVIAAIAIAAALVLAWQLVPRTAHEVETAPGVQAPLVAPAQDSGEALQPTVEREPEHTDVIDEPRAHEASVAADASAQTDAVPRAAGTKAKPKAPQLGGALGLKQETAILREGENALAAGDPLRALAAFDRHAREFPKGQLVPERMFKRAVALCELGRTKAAKKAVDAFVRAYPASPLRARVEDVCAAK
jgi:hypothetical protein